MRAVRTLLLGPLLALSIAAFLAGCQDEEEEFPPSSRITSLRILGIKASPAAVLAGDRTLLESLVVNPFAGVQPLSYLWVVCDPDSSGRSASLCGATSTTRDLSSLLSAQDSLPPGVTVVPIGESIYYRSPRDAFDNVPADSPLRTQGIDATVLLIAYTGLSPADLQDESTVREIALKRIKIFPKGVPKNRNPAVAQVTVNDVPLLDGEKLEFPAGALVSLKATATPESVESYTRPLPDGTELQEDETMVFSWYVTAGTLDQLQKQGVRTPDGVATEYTLPSYDETSGGVIDLYVVLRDARGGMDWVKRSLRVTR